MKQSELFSTDYYSEFLEHHGVNGQKWGHKNGPPYPLAFSKHSAAEKKHLSKYGINKPHRIKKKKNKQSDELPDYTNMSDDERKEARRKAIRNGDVKEANKNKYYYSDRDIQEVLNRYNLNKELSKQAQADIKTTMDKIQSAFRVMDTVKDGAERALAVYNATARIVNTFTDAKWPTSSNKNGNKNKNKKKNGNKGHNNNHNHRNHNNNHNSHNTSGYNNRH